jgi:hypothetical protein
MKKRVVPFWALVAIFIVPMVLGLTHYNTEQRSAADYSQYERTDEKDKKATTETITDPNKLREYAENNGLSKIPVKIETEYQGP